METAPPAGTTATEPWQADRADHQRLITTLARAFFDDPVVAWACPHEHLRMKMLERFYGTYLDIAQSQGWVWSRGDHEAVSLWLAPGEHEITLRDTARFATSLLHPRLAWRLPLVAGGLLRTELRHPSEPDHFYLAVLGTDPDSQGRGHGSALLGQTLEICDADGVPAYLESSKLQNVPFYERHGFRVSGEITLPRGPRVYFMWREPR